MGIVTADMAVTLELVGAGRDQTREHPFGPELGQRLGAWMFDHGDENAEEVYRYLLQRNAKLRSVAYALDIDGDIHLVGRLDRRNLSAEELDTVLGVVLQTADADFNPILERGFAGAIRREWAWRTSRGESVRNLAAFRHLVGDPSN